MSRAYYPKQFLKLVNDNSLLQNTLMRLDGFESSEALVICNEEHRFVVAEQLREANLSCDSIILEPIGRNTAPAIAIAALKLLQDHDDPMMVVLPSDHLIQNNQAFQEAVLKATALAEKGHLVVFGIETQYPETGYGYILRGEKINDSGSKLERFIEKPDQATSKQFHGDENYFWNSGMFVFKATGYLDELKKHNPEMMKCCEQALSKSKVDLDFLRLDKMSLECCPEDSIDYAVMEHTKMGAVVELSSGWSDLGSWNAIWDVRDKDQNGNVSHGDVILENTQGSLVFSEHKLVTTVGVSDMVVVETKDAVMVASKDSVQDVKSIVEKLKTDGRKEFCDFREVHRPWGKYDSIDGGHRFQVKHITVNPGGKLSIQKHYHRAEHWIIVSGTAKVTKGKEEFYLSENESTFIPLGVVHGLENPGRIPLEMIEVQSGSYLDEDDIVRYSDAYGRDNNEEGK
ncbi:mannose-1-phosphate guanylyltransferase/mannose-6-phosphate isomerase [Litoribrevibacter albus]|uniref:mannose-1-phosphate guanylyltransferase n=2 Tax=Litoribrevibacter albus TaxID=1473156 RepID=A0AA37SAL1_9GAMM|nr:mannose-1-phosphate guanylyltransferase/mannose-6-phosphate isomerase [Litoribrevibacter albus]